LKFPQYVFDKKAQKKKNSSESHQQTHKQGSTKHEAIQHYLEDEPIALSPYQTYTIVVGGELSVELY
jgi:hypothetical protein